MPAIYQSLLYKTEVAIMVRHMPGMWEKTLGLWAMADKYKSLSWGCAEYLRYPSDVCPLGCLVSDVIMFLCWQPVAPLLRKALAFNFGETDTFSRPERKHGDDQMGPKASCWIKWSVCLYRKRYWIHTSYIMAVVVSLPFLFRKCSAA